MRIVLMGLAIISTSLVAGAELVDAQSRPPRPYCLQSGRGGPGGGLPFCAFYTMEQCLQSVGGGTDGCFPNPDVAWDRIEGKRYTPPRGKTRDRGY